MPKHHKPKRLGLTWVGGSALAIVAVASLAYAAMNMASNRSRSKVSPACEDDSCQKARDDESAATAWLENDEKYVEGTLIEPVALQSP